MELRDWNQPENEKVDVDVEFFPSEVKFIYQIPFENIQVENFKSLHERKRRDELWKGNCLELFWSFDEKSYWEMNLSLSGDWQIYRFSEYRGKAEQEIRVHIEDLQRRSIDDSLRMEGRVTSTDLKFNQVKIFNPTVILDKSGGKHFFASRHGEQPDFHRQDLWLRNSK